MEQHAKYWNNVKHFKRKICKIWKHFSKKHNLFCTLVFYPKSLLYIQSLHFWNTFSLKYLKNSTWKNSKRLFSFCFGLSVLFESTLNLSILPILLKFYTETSVRYSWNFIGILKNNGKTCKTLKKYGKFYTENSVTFEIIYPKNS